MKNRKIRTAMIRAGLNQSQLAELLDIPTSQLSVVLKYELSQKEQDAIVNVIRENETQEV